MSPTERLTKAQRREQARAEALRIRAEQERAAKRRRTWGIAGAAAVIVGIGVLVFAILNSNRTPALQQVQPPFAADNGGGIVMDASGIVTPPADADADWPIGAFDDAVVVTVYSDPICPACGVFEATAGQVLDQMRQDGEVVVDHRLVGNLDGYSLGSRYSTRAVQALYTVADEAPEAFGDFLTTLFANQPAENTTGLTDEEIADIARGAGVPDAAVEAIGEGRYTWWVGQVTDVAREKFAPQFATPTVLLNGEQLDRTVDWRDEATLRASIEDARG